VQRVESRLVQRVGPRGVRARSIASAHTNLVIATIIPISTNTTIATCIQIQFWGIRSDSLPRRSVLPDREVQTSPAAHHYRVRMAGSHEASKAGRLRRLAAACTLGLSCALLALLPTGAASGAPAVYAQAPTAPMGGINITTLSASAPLSEADHEIAFAHALHVKVVRVEVPWATLEPDGPAQLEPHALAFLDRLVSDAAAKHIGVIATVDTTPCWASSAPTTLLNKCVPGRTLGANAWPPREPSAYAAFTAYLAARYGTRLAAIEVWNEPDQANEHYFAGPDKPQRYAAILRAAYPAIKQADPNIPVLAGSLVGSNGVFLRYLYAAGIKGYYNGLAVHFYNLTLGSLRTIHEVQLANGDTTPLWLDEFGWPSCWPQHKLEQEQACVTRGVQAQNIANLVHSLARTRYVAAEVLYGLQDTSRESFGVLTAGNRRKPAFAAFAQALSSPFAGSSRVTLRLRARGGHVIASGSGPVGDYMELEASQGGTPRYKALFTLNRFDRYSIALPAALGSSGLTVRVYQYWAGAGHDAQASI
jgi:hypothetical protein